MGTNTAISWTNHTVNFWVGCDHVSLGCDHCYMFSEQKRYGNNPEVVRRTSDATFYAPLKKKEFQQPGKVFTCSWSDFFHHEADAWRDDAWGVIRQTPHLSWQILTKRHGRIARHLPADWGVGWSNVWLGVTGENQEWADRRIAELAKIPAAVRFLSYEPALGALNLTEWISSNPFTRANSHSTRTGHATIQLFGTKRQTFGCLGCNAVWEANQAPALDWVIVGGESGVHARTMELEWARTVVKQCREAGVAVFVKQMGNVLAKRLKLAHSKGGDVNEFPEELHVQEFPKVREAVTA